MRPHLPAFIALCWAGSAFAADAPRIAPPEAWIRPAATPKLPPLAPGSAAAARTLLVDTQYRFSPAGTSTYFETVTRAQTPQGLAALGTLSLPWKPETDEIVVHKVNILRGDQVIDALAGHAFTILRRETNLESAMLDGVLTATLQVEGLQEGDAIDVAATYRRNDPLLSPHAEGHFDWSAGSAVDHLRLRAVWAKPLVIRWRAGDQLDKPRLTESAGASELTLDMTNVEPLRPPAEAPARFSHTREIDFSDFASWAELSARFEPLYRKASTLAPDSPLRAEVARIRALSTDPAVRAAAALALVQDKVRYVFLGMNDGALTPTDADSTWSRRFGDCKGKTALLLALLRELGIDAQPALVTTTLGDGLDARPPMVSVFDHAVVRAVIAGRTYWLDGTRTGDVSLARLRVPPFQWALPVQAAGAVLVPLKLEPLDEPEGAQSLRLDASAGVAIPASAHAEASFRGDVATKVHLQLADGAPADVDRAMRDYWTKRYDFIEVKSVAASYDAALGEERWTMDGLAKMAWDTPQGGGRPRYEADGARLGWKSDFKRDPGPHADAPVAVDFPAYERSTETIILPHAGKGFTVIGGDIDQAAAGRTFRRTARIDKGVFTMEAVWRATAQEISVKDAVAGAKALTAMAGQGLYIEQPAGYVETDAELAADRASAPTTARGFNDRGWAYLKAGDRTRAVADFDRAVALDPAWAGPLANRAVARFDDDRFDLARADADKALALDPADATALNTLGLLASREGRFADAVAAHAKARDQNPTDVWTRRKLADAQFALGQYDKALEEIGVVAKLDPDWPHLHTARASILMAQGRPAQARAELDAALAAWPFDPDVRLTRARLLADLGFAAEARREMDVVVAAHPTVETWLTHDYMRDRADRAGRLADIDHAHRLDPKATGPIIQRAEVEARAGDASRADQDLAAAAAVAAPADQSLLQIYRGEIEAMTGRLDQARRTFAAVRPKIAASAERLNDLCWTEAGFDALATDALADCDAALRLLPLAAAIHDSRALPLLRLGRLDEAIAEYDRALSFNPHLGPSLFARGIARLRKGQVKEGQADLDAARALNVRVGEELDEMGVRP